MVETKPISCLRSVELLDRGNIVQVTGRAFVAGTLPVKVCQRAVLSLCLAVLLIVELCSSGLMSLIIATVATSHSASLTNAVQLILYDSYSYQHCIIAAKEAVAAAAEAPLLHHPLGIASRHTFAPHPHTPFS